MKIDIRTNKVVYITIGRWTYYIDDSTNEQIIQVFSNKQSFLNQKTKKYDRKSINKSTSK